MFDKNDIEIARQMYQDGKLPSDILRHFATSQKCRAVPDLMQLLCDAFSLSFEEVLCIGGWWYDGSGELTDERLNDFLKPAIDKAS